MKGRDTIKTRKVWIHKKELEFLGFIVGIYRVYINPKKVEAVLE